MKGLLLDWSAYKRAAALLDFDDLLHAARDLLAGHEDVRRALAGRFRHVLVDEFQNTLSADDLRDAEAERVAELCTRLVGNVRVGDRGLRRPCRFGDVALLAPVAPTCGDSRSRGVDPGRQLFLPPPGGPSR